MQSKVGWVRRASYKGLKINSPSERVVTQHSTTCGASYQMTEAALKAPDRRRDYAEARAVIAYAATRLDSASLSDVATHLSRDIATLSTGVRRLASKVKTSALKTPGCEVLKELGLINRDIKA